MWVVSVRHPRILRRTVVPKRLTEKKAIPLQHIKIPEDPEFDVIAKKKHVPQYFFVRNNPQSTFLNRSSTIFPSIRSFPDEFLVDGRLRSLIDVDCIINQTSPSLFVSQLRQVLIEFGSKNQ